MVRALDPIEKTIYRLAKPYLKVRGNDIHTESALLLALRILESVDADRKIVVPGVILHDVGWNEVPPDIIRKAFGINADPELTRIHEIEGAKIAREILNKVNYEACLIPEILYIIDGHDTRKHASTINEKIVRDADILSRYTKDVLQFFIKYQNRTPKEFHSYLTSNLDKWFFLEISKEIAREELKKRLKDTITSSDS